jgi:purine-nucleoside/S-methyl-5'-thioadenosine phosphorylase / adenosine deaminase
MVTCSGQDIMVGDFSQLNGNDTLHCRYGFFNRHGGKSKGEYDSLNVGLHVGDDEPSVQANRRIVKSAMGASVLLSALQVHGTKIHVQNSPQVKDLEVEGYDALITNQRGVALLVQHADCQAVLLYDSVAGVAAGVHNGWRGSVQNILGKVVAVMVRDFSSHPDNIQAVVGPSLGPCCAEFRNYQSELPEEFVEFKVSNNHFDFWRISRKQLMETGIQQTNVILSGQCTLCSADYFSYRKAVQTGDGVTGRNGSVIVMNEF